MTVIDFYILGLITKTSYIKTTTKSETKTIILFLISGQRSPTTAQTAFSTSSLHHKIDQAFPIFRMKRWKTWGTRLLLQGNIARNCSQKRTSTHKNIQIKFSFRAIPSNFTRECDLDIIIISPPLLPPVRFSLGTKHHWHTWLCLLWIQHSCLMATIV